MNKIRYLMGLNRLRHGYCPACNSSPPMGSCPICLGEHRYGYQLRDANRALWLKRWEDRA